MNKTSAAVKGAPLWKVTFRRRWKVHVMPPGETVQPSAKAETIPRQAPTRNTPANNNVNVRTRQASSPCVSCVFRRPSRCPDRVLRLL